MTYRILSVILLATMLLTACGEQSGFPEVEGLDLEATTPLLNYNFTSRIYWVSPNPGSRWFVVGRDLGANNVSTRIRMHIEAKDSTGQPFDEILARLTISPYTLEATDNGYVYAHGTSTGEYVIFRDFPDFVVSLTLIDTFTDAITPELISDWEQIALEGNLVFLE